MKKTKSDIEDFFECFTQSCFVVFMTYVSLEYGTQVIKTNKDDFTLSLHNIFLDYAVINWCKIFADKNSKIHFHNIFENLNKQPYSDDKLSPSKIKKQLLEKIILNDEEYISFWETIITWRNKGGAHHDMPEVYKLQVPDWGKMKIQCIEMINKFIETINQLECYYATKEQNKISIMEILSLLSQTKRILQNYENFEVYAINLSLFKPK